MDLHSALSTFVRASETLSFSAVALERHTTQSAVSRQVAALEAYYGVRLMQRTTRRLALTEEGRELLPYARALLDAADAASEAMSVRRGAVTGRVRLAVPTALGLWLSGRMDALLQGHPGLELELVQHVGASMDGDAAITAGYDLLVCVGDVPGGASMVVRRIGEVSYALVAAPSYLERRGAPVRPGDLHGHDCLSYGEPRQRDGTAWEFLGREGGMTLYVRSRFHLGTSELACRAAVQGLGLALLPWPLARPEVEAGRLCAVMPGWEPKTSSLYAAYPSRRNLAARTRAVLDFVLAEVGAARNGMLRPVSTLARPDAPAPLGSGAGAPGG